MAPLILIQLTSFVETAKRSFLYAFQRAVEIAFVSLEIAFKEEKATKGEQSRAEQSKAEVNNL